MEDRYATAFAAATGHDLGPRAAYAELAGLVAEVGERLKAGPDVTGELAAALTGALWALLTVAGRCDADVAGGFDRLLAARRADAP